MPLICLSSQGVKMSGFLKSSLFIWQPWTGPSCLCEFCIACIFEVMYQVFVTPGFKTLRNLFGVWCELFFPYMLSFSSCPHCTFPSKWQISRANVVCCFTLIGNGNTAYRRIALHLTSSHPISSYLIPCFRELLHLLHRIHVRFCS